MIDIAALTENTSLIGRRGSLSQPQLQWLSDIGRRQAHRQVGTTLLASDAETKGIHGYYNCGLGFLQIDPAAVAAGASRQFPACMLRRFEFGALADLYLCADALFAHLCRHLLHTYTRYPQRQAPVGIYYEPPLDCTSHLVHLSDQVLEKMIEWGFEKLSARNQLFLPMQTLIHCALAVFDEDLLISDDRP